MKLLAKLMVLYVIFLPLVLMGMLMLVVENEPIVHGRTEMTPERIARGKRVFELNDPSRLKSGSIAIASLDQADLNLAINYFANQYLNGGARLKIDQGRAVIEGTLKLPANPLGRYLNLKIELNQTDKLPQIDYMMLGKLWVPGVLANSVIKNSFAVMDSLIDSQKFHDMIKSVQFEHQRMSVTYRWQNNLPAKISGVFLSAQDQNRIETYQRRLSELTQGGKSNLNLTALMQPLFQLAKDRSINGEAVAENRAVILVLTFYTNQRGLNKIIPQSKTWSRPTSRRVILNDRDDFPKHYLVSAMLAAYAGTPLSDAMGLFKEIEDSRGGSGFSFNDIAADRAGTRMGELAIGNEQWAKKIQLLMVTAKGSDIMPVTADLPEFLPEAEFKRRFGGIKDESYRQMMGEIERRIAALPINL